MRSANIPRKISNIVELMKLAALVEDFPPEPDRIHLSNGTLFLGGTFTEGRPENRPQPFPRGLQPQRPETCSMAEISGWAALSGGHPHLAGIYRLLPDSQQQGAADDGH